VAGRGRDPGRRPAASSRLLAAGVAVQAWNQTPDKLAGLLARGATPLAAPALSQTEVAFRVDPARVRALAYESRDYLASRAGFTVNPVAAPSRREIQDPYLREGHGRPRDGR
jgi:hypothetical protein